jgi:hypothetical protein
VRYLQAREKGDWANEAAFYEDAVHYFDEGSVPRDRIRAAHEREYRRWPERKYVLLNRSPRTSRIELERLGHGADSERRASKPNGSRFEDGRCLLSAPASGLGLADCRDASAGAGRAMSVRTRILLLLLVVAAIFVAGLLAGRKIERQNFASVLAERASAWEQAVERFLQEQGAPLAKMTEHLSSQDGAAAALIAADREWAEREWDEKMLASYGASAVWVHAADGPAVLCSSEY